MGPGGPGGPVRPDRKRCSILPPLLYYSLVAACIYVLQTFPKTFTKQRKIVEDRLAKYMTDGKFLAAYLLHHRLNGKDLTPEQTRAAQKFIVEWGVPEDQLTLYLGMKEPFHKASFDSDVDPAPGVFFSGQSFFQGQSVM